MAWGGGRRRLARDPDKLLQYLRIPVAAAVAHIYAARAVPAPPVAAAAVPVLGPPVPELVPPSEPVAAAAAVAVVVHS